MRAEPTRRGQLLMGAGVVACLCALGLAILDPRGALTGWLGAAAAFAGIPAGALCLQSMMRLIPGTWGEEMRLSCEAGALLAIPALVAFVPVLSGLALIYPETPAASTFRAVWMTPFAIGLRTLLWFAIVIASGALLRRRWKTVPVAIVFLILFALLGSFVAVDWLMALERGFASSGFGLTILILWVNIAFAALLLLRLPLGRAPRRPGVLGALLLTMLLMWAYIQFLSFFIEWSPGLRDGAAYYGQRIGGVWSAEIAVFGALGLVPLLLLLLPRFRRSRRWLMALSASVLAGKLLEFAWFALPGRGGVGVAAFLLTAVGLGLLAVALLPVALRRRVGARMSGRRG